MRVAFRVDASVQIGTGHLMRCLTLADELRRRGATTRFVCRSLPERFAALITSAGHESTLLPRSSTSGREDAGRLAHGEWLAASPEEDARATLAAISDARCDWLVVDHYGIDARWESLVRAGVERVLVIDDLADREHSADVLLDQNIQLDAERYANRVPARCKRLLGPAFALLRPEFREWRTRPSLEAAGPSRINVFFGGADPNGTTLRVVESLRRLSRRDVAADVVVGAANPLREEIVREAACIPGVRVSVDVANMGETFARAHVGLGAGGTTTWERCCIGLPTVVVSIAANQRNGCNAVARARAAIDLGDVDQVTADMMVGKAVDLLERPKLLQQMRRRAQRLVDGRGAERVSLFMTRDELSLRRACADDARTAWRWRNDASTRRFSLDSSAVAWETHVDWWKTSVDSPDRWLLVATCGGTDVGILRFDAAKDRLATVSIYVDPELHGLGLGTVMLRLGRRWVEMHLPEVQAIRAEILPENTASTRMFAAAGYEPTGRRLEWLQRIPRCP